MLIGKRWAVVGLLLLVSAFGVLSQVSFDKVFPGDRHLLLKKNGVTEFEVKVLENSDDCLIDCYALLWIDPHTDFTFPISQNSLLKFDVLNLGKSKNPLKDFSILINDTVTVDYGPYTRTVQTGVNGKYANGSGIPVWDTEQFSTIREVEVWRPVIWGEKVSGPFRIKIEAKKEFKGGVVNTVDWVPTFQGVRVDEWLLWEGAEYNSYVIPELNNSATFGLRDHPVKGVFKCHGEGCGGGHITVLINNATALPYGSRVLNSSNSSFSYIEYSFKIPRLDKETTNTSVYVWFDTNETTYGNTTWETAYYNVWDDFEDGTPDLEVANWSVISGGGPDWVYSDAQSLNGSLSALANSSTGTDHALSLTIPYQPPVKIRVHYWLYTVEGSTNGGLMRFAPSSDNGSFGTLDMAAHSDLDSVCTGSAPCWTGNTAGSWASREEPILTDVWQEFEIILNSTDDRLHYRINGTATESNNDVIESGAVANITVLALNIRSAGDGQWYMDDLQAEFLPRINVISNTYHYEQPAPITINWTVRGDNSSGTEPKHRSDTDTFALWVADKNLASYWTEHNATGFFLNTSTASVPASNWTNTTINTNLSRSEVYAWRTFANDSSGTENNTGWTYVTVQNTAPLWAGTGILPSSPHTGQDLYCNGTATDPDTTDTLTATSRWFKGVSLQFSIGNTVTNGTNDNVSVLFYGNTTKGETWTCEAYVSDGTVESVRVNDSVTILNSDPTLEATSSAPATLFTNTPFYPKVTVADRDADSLQGCVRYWVDASTVGSWCVSVTNNTATNVTYLKSGNFSKGEVVKAELYGSDGTSETSRSNLSETVQNTAPTSPTISTPANDSTGTGNLLNVSWSLSTDADGDSITYYVGFNDTDPPGVNLSTADQFSEFGTVDGTKYFMRVLASDGSDNSSFSDITHFLENEEPEGNMSLSPSNPQTDTNVTCSASTSDADGHNVTVVEFFWWENFVELNYNSSVLLPGNLTHGNVYWCGANLTDSYEFSLAANSSNGTAFDPAFLDDRFLQVTAKDSVSLSSVSVNLSASNTTGTFTKLQSQNPLYLNLRHYDSFNYIGPNLGLWNVETEDTSSSGSKAYVNQTNAAPIGGAIRLMTEIGAGGQVNATITSERPVREFLEFYVNSSNFDQTGGGAITDTVGLFLGGTHVINLTNSGAHTWTVSKVNTSFVQVFKDGVSQENVSASMDVPAVFMNYLAFNVGTTRGNVTLDWVIVDNQTGFLTNGVSFGVDAANYGSTTLYQEINETLNYTLEVWLTDSDDGRNTFYRVQNSSGNVLEDTTVNITKLIDGAFRTVFSDVTDASGSVSAFLDSSETYRHNFTHPTHTSEEFDLKPDAEPPNYIITLGLLFDPIQDEIYDVINWSIEWNETAATIDTSWNDSSSLTEWVKTTAYNFTDMTEVYGENQSSGFEWHITNLSVNSTYLVVLDYSHSQFGENNVSRIVSWEYGKLFGFSVDHVKWVAALLIVVLASVGSVFFSPYIGILTSLAVGLFYVWGWFGTTLSVGMIALMVVLAIVNYVNKRGGF